EKPGEPHTLTFSPNANTIHSVIPVAAANQRKSMSSTRCSTIQNVNAVIEHAGVKVRRVWHGVQLFFVLVEKSHCEVRRALIENGVIAGHLQIVIDNEWKPHEIIRELRPQAASAVRMPPMLYITLDELPARSFDYLIASE